MFRRRNKKSAKHSAQEAAKAPIDPSTVPEAKPPVQAPAEIDVEAKVSAAAPDDGVRAPAAPEPGETAGEVRDEAQSAGTAVSAGSPSPDSPDSPGSPGSPDSPGSPGSPDSTASPESPTQPVTPEPAAATASPPAPQAPPLPPKPAAPPAPPLREAVPEPTRPPTRATLPPTSPLASSRGSFVGGIDLGGTKIAAAVIGPGHKVIAYRRRPTPDRGGPADVVRAMAVTMQEAARDAGIEAHQLKAVGVGAPGSVDPGTGAVSNAGNLPGWDGKFQLGMALRDAIGTPVTVGNDVQVGTNAEFYLGAGAGFNSILGVFWGTGIGGGIILDGKSWKGRGRAGEIGHTLVRRGGAKEPNGLRGTVEAYAGRKAMEAKAMREVQKGRQTDLFKLAKKHGKTHLTSAIWAHALEHEDELATEILNRAVRALSAGIASAVNLLDIEAVIIGGGLGVRFADTLVQDVIDGMDKYLLDPEDPPSVRVAGLGDEGGVIGASLLVA